MTELKFTPGAERSAALAVVVVVIAVVVIAAGAAAVVMWRCRKLHTVPVFFWGGLRLPKNGQI